jgi:hypothetical protein
MVLADEDEDEADELAEENEPSFLEDGAKDCFGSD